MSSGIYHSHKCKFSAGGILLIFERIPGNKIPYSIVAFVK